MSKVQKKSSVPINKELHWVLQNWDDIMACMMSGTHLDREVYTAGHLSGPVQKGISGYLHIPRNIGNGSGRAPKTSTKTTFTTQSATEEGILSQQQEEDKDLGEKDTRED